ncbi:MAG: hypothetical protein GC178_01655 [Flavobacteriales bacterium]|nr:hypothetical protein [Flavobacteriales bacterium]
MGRNAESGLNYYLVIDGGDDEALRGLMSYQHLKVARDGTKTWVTGFCEALINATVVLVIPNKSTYYERCGNLFPTGSLLPAMKMPTSLLWTPINRAVDVTLGSLNHNFFGIDQQWDVQLVESNIEHEPNVLRVKLQTLETYTSAAPTIRLKGLSWVRLNENEALVFGRPLLPLNGKAYYQQGQAIVPIGSEFELYILAEQMHLRMDAERTNLFVWSEDARFFTVPKENVVPLSRSSVRLSANQTELP